MKIHRFIIETNNLAESANRPINISDKQLFHQMKNVLKLKPDEIITVADGRGLEAQGRIIKFNRGQVEVHLNEVVRNLIEPKNNITLYPALIKRQNFELVVEKATELGVNKIVPIITDKTIKLNLNISRLKKIAKEAAEQSGRALVPEIMPAVSFKEALEGSRENNINLFFTPTANEPFRNKFSQSERIGLFIGPEGGWSETEHYLAEANNFKFISLGKFILKADTAAVLAVFVALE